MSSDLHDFTIGQRILCDGHVATIKYTGEVPPTKGDWLGVEWDDPSRGKHNGTHEGKTYFTTQHETSGSFIRPKKANTGITLERALQERYGIVDDENAGVITEDMFVYGDKNQMTEVEVVGMKALNERQSKFDALVEVALRDAVINGSSPGEVLKSLAPNITELDISKNLISSWEEVAKIASQLSRLEVLTLSENKLLIPENKVNLRTAFSALRVLLLNKMALTWKEVLACSQMWPDIKELYVCSNSIERISPPGSTLQSLEILNLEGNPIKSWSHVNHLGTLPRLHTLLLNDTQLEDICFSEDPCDSQTTLFPALKSLSLTNNKLERWTDINELNKLKSLEELRFSRNPVLATTVPETARQWVIAEVKSLKLINRTEVTSEERKGAEIDYLKRFGKEWMAAGGSEDVKRCNTSIEFKRMHPRYEELVKLWGAPEESEMKEISGALKHNLLDVSIFSPKMPERVPIKKKLPATMTIQKVKTLVQRLFKLKTHDIQLSYLSQQVPESEIEMDNDLRQLSFYAIETNDTICVKW